jgi:DAK2 domain fusion protein YloV
MSNIVGKMAQEMFDGSALRKAFRTALARVESHVDELNRLNVFPVPDGDTGVNMMLTLRAANRAIADLASNSAAVVAATAARGALLGASGNSGVILSQILRGIARGLEMKDRFSPSHFAQALHAAAEHAYRAVTNPAEGTILTVSKDVARTALTMAERGAGFSEMMSAVVTQADRTVKKTPEMLPQLKEAGVEDAGARGLLYVLQGMKDAISSRVGRVRVGRSAKRAAPAAAKARHVERRYGFDVQFLLRGNHLPVAEIRHRIETMGESVLVVGDEEIVRVHIHTLEPEAVLNYARGVGDVSDVEVQDMDEQVAGLGKCGSAKHGTHSR